MTPLRVRPATMSDAALLAPKLRRADLQEVEASTGETARNALERGISTSDPCLAVVDPVGDPIAVFGVVPDRADTGIVWLLGSDAIQHHAPTFARQSRVWLDRLHSRYRVLRNFVDARNQLHLRWLTRCGFQVLGLTEDYGVEPAPFYEVEHVRE